MARARRQIAGETVTGSLVDAPDRGLVMLFFVVGFARDASAHASLVSVEPSDGSVLAATPKTVQLRFNEPVTPAVISLVDASGKARGDIAIRAVDQTITLTLPDALPRGTQMVSYRIISADGHPVGGSLAFSIGEVTGAAKPPAGDPAVAVADLADADRGLSRIVRRRRRRVLRGLDRAGA